MILRVERNPNCIDLEPTELHEVSPAVEVSRVRVRWKYMPCDSDRLEEELVWADVWGWSSRRGGSRTPAYAQWVIDPDGDEGIVIYGDDWGIKVQVRDEVIGRNILWVALDQVRDNLPADVLEKLGVDAH
ncbi:MAG TPA: hypothetical protein VNP04_00675 [Alphaproteobacteria bacterium]|nr:hypothetical protein [Alphaproteobacteria bacterium]